MPEWDNTQSGRKDKERRRGAITDGDTTFPGRDPLPPLYRRMPKPTAHEPYPLVGCRLGKHPAKMDARTLKMAKYLPVSLPPAPLQADWLSGVTDWGMMGNDRLGDCTIAAVAHACQVWTGATGPMWTATDAEVQDYYSKWDGYVPGDPSTDNGGVELDVLNRWRAEGFCGMKLLAYVDPAPGNGEHIRQAIHLFGGVYIGLQLPLSAQSQIGDIWTDLGDMPGGWGGHAVFVPYYDPEGLICITWGKRQRMTWDFWKHYCDESHALLSEVWLDRVPGDFGLVNLNDDLQALNN